MSSFYHMLNVLYHIVSHRTLVKASLIVRLMDKIKRLVDGCMVTQKCKLLLVSKHVITKCTYAVKLTENTGRKITKNSQSGHHHTTLSGYIFATKAHI